MRVDRDGSTVGALFCMQTNAACGRHPGAAGAYSAKVNSLMHLIPTPSRQRASAALRDRFLNALEERNDPVLRVAVRELLGCVNILPDATCIGLGLAQGSTFGDAAQAIAASFLPRPEAA